jgi:hypothetical protein
VAKKPNTSGLKRYQKLRAQAKARGITVPKGTDTAGLQRLLAGKATESQTRETVRKKRQTKATSKRPSRVPKGAKSAKIHWGW